MQGPSGCKAKCILDTCAQAVSLSQQKHHRNSEVLDAIDLQMTASIVVFVSDIVLVGQAEDTINVEAGIAGREQKESSSKAAKAVDLADDFERILGGS